MKKIFTAVLAILFSVTLAVVAPAQEEEKAMNKERNTYKGGKTTDVNKENEEKNRERNQIKNNQTKDGTGEKNREQIRERKEIKEEQKDAKTEQRQQKRQHKGSGDSRKGNN